DVRVRLVEVVGDGVDRLDAVGRIEHDVARVRPERHGERGEGDAGKADAWHGSPPPRWVWLRRHYRFTGTTCPPGRASASPPPRAPRPRGTRARPSRSRDRPGGRAP